MAPIEERMDAPMPPRGNAPKLVEIKISVPQGTLEESLEMASAMGLSPGEFNRMAWILGVHTLAEGDNKLKVNRQLRHREEWNSSTKSENDE